MKLNVGISKRSKGAGCFFLTRFEPAPLNDKIGRFPPSYPAIHNIRTSRALMILMILKLKSLKSIETHSPSSLSQHPQK
jgi:hypothetical protein